MRSSALLLLALLAAAVCLAHAGAESAAPHRSLASGGLSPTGPGSDSDWCWESLLTLGMWCKHDLLASFLAGRPAPRACCRAADEAVHHCGPFTRAFLGSLLPLGPLAQCAHPVITGTPATRPGARGPPRAPTLETGARVSGGARPQPPPPATAEARTGARFPPPRAPTGASSGTRGTTPAPNPEMSARLPPLPVAPPRVASGTPKRPPRSSVRIPPPEAPSGTQGSPGPKPQTTTRVPALSGGARDGSLPKPKVIAGGSAGGRARRAPDAYAAGAPLGAGAAPPPRKGVRTARPSTKSPAVE
ncbi:hypothetical protein SEVIR_7G228650v4 [Setaria viridis]|uniref:Prolamin-like domain-containing protein n=1 Tax=Setaria viridis TaxID=4556 RepID=A0A4V6D4F2_SETVI|nr:uncharacterized protein LOC101780625 [Setaria italica]XP_034604804.1 translation initiation factor IF-2-like [Setaria viridis]TKW06226.1 hypothetical protein SEVIR_7G228650v2 [Setaria viridis]